MRKTIMFVSLLASVAAAAQNPIIRDQFTADPTARVFNGKVYLYPSHDIHAPEGQRQDWFCMADYHVFSSDNLTEWKDHGVIVTQNKVPWVRPDSYSMWAPDCVCKNGKYYFYFPSAPKDGHGFGIGVATSDKPEGPFTCEAEPIKGVMGIDPCVLIDDDGKSYMYWAGGPMRGALLNDNMKELAGEVKVMEGLPEGFKEGPFAFKHAGNYYLTFPWVRKDNGTETLAYAMSKSPLGPWDFKGIIMAESPTGCWTNHHSIVEYKGQWYLFYHHNDYSPNMDKRRSARIDRLYFNSDGTIKEVVPTLRGVGINKATECLQIDRYSKASQGVAVQLLDTIDTFKGWEAKLPGKGSWLAYDDVDFSPLGDCYMIANVMAHDNTEFFIHEGSAKGRVIAKCKVMCKTGGQRPRDNSGRWMTVTAPVSHVPEGVKSLYFVCDGKEVHVDWVQFKNREKYFSPAPSTASVPDADGFIRRWLVLEPIDKPNQTNTVFVDTYLRQELGKEYFKGQFSVFPKDKQAVKVGKQNLRWHALESERYNLKLFRFAERMEKPVYGVLFWVVTAIDCDADIDNVRLAVGSNSASMWWLNGEEALLLSGDRRMVKDDGMSPRVSLKKGRNILRGAVINGPGMSDFCVRLLDEKGNPVRNITINHK